MLASELPFKDGDNGTPYVSDKELESRLKETTLQLKDFFS